MDAIQSIFQNKKINSGITPPSLFSIRDFRKAMAIKAYQKAGGEHSCETGRFQTQILCAVNRWLSSGNIRIEFYSAKHSGEVRVKIINDDNGIGTCDISLSRFVSSSPATS
jgi:hypothetical protein